MAVMIKISGACLVVFAAFYYAKEVNGYTDLRLKQIIAFYNILLQLKSELMYMNYTLPECFMNMSDKVDEPFSYWFSNMAEQMNIESTKTFSEIFTDNLDYIRCHSALNEGDIVIISELKDKFNTADIEVMKKAIDYVLLRLEEQRITLGNELKDKKKVVISLSLFAGITMVILLL